MPKRQIFYSFHFSRDFWRVQQIRQMGVIEGNTPVSSNDWEAVKRNGYLAIKNWIDNAMRYRSCVVILYGNETHSREWVQYEIEHGWNTGKGVLAIAIDRLEDQNGNQDIKGKNPLSNFILNPYTGQVRQKRFISQYGEINLAEVAPSFETQYCSSKYAYGDIKENLEWMIEDAINIRNKFPK